MTETPKEDWSGAVFNRGEPEHSWPTIRWFPISSLADEREVLLYQDGRGMLVGYIERGIDISGKPWLRVEATTAPLGYDSVEHEREVDNPTHWSPLPLPPGHRVYVSSERIRRELTDEEIIATQ
jgi:hypothetical protein